MLHSDDIASERERQHIQIAIFRSLINRRMNKREYMRKAMSWKGERSGRSKQENYCQWFRWVTWNFLCVYFNMIDVINELEWDSKLKMSPSPFLLFSSTLPTFSWCWLRPVILSISRHQLRIIDVFSLIVNRHYVTDRQVSLTLRRMEATLANANMRYTAVSPERWTWG